MAADPFDDLAAFHTRTLRNAEIVSARRAGTCLDEIAAKCQLSRSRIKQLVAGTVEEEAGKTGRRLHRCVWLPQPQRASLQLYNTDGSFSGRITAAVNNIPQQMFVRANGNVLMSANGSTPMGSFGLYKLGSNGGVLKSWAGTPGLGVRGVAELGDGLYLIIEAGGSSASRGLGTIDPNGLQNNNDFSLIRLRGRRHSRGDATPASNEGALEHPPQARRMQSETTERRMTWALVAPFYSVPWLAPRYPVPAWRVWAAWVAWAGPCLLPGLPQRNRQVTSRPWSAST